MGFRVLTDIHFGAVLACFGMELQVQTVHLIAQSSLDFPKQAIDLNSQSWMPFKIVLREPGMFCDVAV